MLKSSKMIVALTGTTGFIGSALKEKLSRKNSIKLRLFNRDKHSLLDPKTLNPLFKNADVIYHLAAINDSNDPLLFDINVSGTFNIVQAIKNNAKPNCKLIFTSSFSVYKTPARNELVTEKFPVAPNTLYGLSKKMAEELILFQVQNYGLNATILRISNPYGPGVPSYKHSVIGTFIEQLKRNQPITVHGKGNQTRDFIYIDDVTSALLGALRSKEKNRANIINICSERSISINDLISNLETISNKKVPIIKFNHYKGLGYWNASNKKAKKVLKWKSKIDIYKGLLKTWEYSINHK